MEKIENKKIDFEAIYDLIILVINEAKSINKFFILAAFKITLFKSD
jgi:hypothetical protein